MKKLKYILIVLVQLNLIFLILNLNKEEYSQKSLLCYGYNNLTTSNDVLKIELDEDNYIYEYITYYAKLNDNNYKQPLYLKEDYFKTNKNNYTINNKSYVSTKNKATEEMSMYEVYNNYDNLSCINQ